MLHKAPQLCQTHTAGQQTAKREIMGIYKELDIDYQQIVDQEADRLIAGVKTPREQSGETKIWQTIAPIDYDLADSLVSQYPYEAALVCIERGEIPTDNPEWQRLVVSLAYNAITNTEQFESLTAHSRFSVADIQRMLDLAAGAVLQHPNFRLTGFQQISPK